MAHGAHLLARLAFTREHHVWYRLGLTQPRDRRALPPQVSVTEATSDREVDDIGALGQDPGTAHRYFADGHTLWLARDGDDVLFACWIFTDWAPMFAVPGQRMRLWPGSALLEDSFVSPLARGRGIAPASWSLIADRLEEQGVRALLTKVETTNRSSRVAVEKAGFRELGVMDLTKVGPYRRTTVQPIGSRAEVEPLTRSLHARLGDEPRPLG